MERILFDTENPCSIKYVGWFAGIICNIARYCLNSFVQGYCVKMLTKCSESLLNAPENQIRDIDNDIIASVHDAMEQVFKRTFDSETTYSKTESFILDMAIKCVKSEVLKRKLDGITLLCQMNDKLVHNDLFFMDGEKIAKRIKKENILESVMKGHPQLISKTSGIFKMLCNVHEISVAELDLLWNCVRNGDIDTKNSVMGILSDINFYMDIQHIMYFVEKMCSVPTNVLHLEEVEFAHQLLQNGRISHDITEEETTALCNKIVMLLFNIATDDSIQNVEIVKKASKELKKAMKYTDNCDASETVFNQCVENVKNNKAVLQSLKIVKKILKINQYKESLMKYLLQKNTIDNIFENLQYLKSEIKTKIEAAGLKPSDISYEQVSKYMPSQRYSYEANVMKRIEFIDTLVFSAEIGDAEILSLFNKVWDELVMNSLLHIESTYFREWFKEFLTKFGEVIDHSLLSSFFYDKIKHLSDENIQGGEELLKTFTQIFLKINILSKKLEEKELKLVHEFKSSYGPKDEESKSIYIVKVNPNELEGIEALWNIILNSKDVFMANDLIQFVTQLYTLPQAEVED